MNTREDDFWNQRSGPRIAPEHFGDIIATAADLALVIDTEDRIVSVATNPLNGSIGQIDHWGGRPIADVLARDSHEKVHRRLRDMRAGAVPTPAHAIEVNHRDGADWEAPIRYTLHPTGRDDRILMLGRDMRPVVELQQRLVRAQLALEKDYEEQRVYETRYRVILAECRDPLILVEAGAGRILDANDAAARRLGVSARELANGPFTQEFEGRRRAEFLDALIAAARAGARGAAVEVTARRNGAALAIRPRMVRNGAERVLVCRLERVGAPPPEASDDRLLGRLAMLWRDGPGAIAFADDNGHLEGANEAFLRLVDADSLAEIRGRAFTDFLNRGAIDQKVLTGAERPRAYATRLQSIYGTLVPVEISATAMPDGGEGYLIHEATLGDAGMPDTFGMQADGAPEDGARRAAAELVGTVPLRDIVASMTDQIEKDCIETAIELTGNNRVAAAEMLGLSRQSLYVKLRKFDLLDRHES